MLRRDRHGRGLSCSVITRLDVGESKAYDSVRRMLHDLFRDIWVRTRSESDTLLLEFNHARLKDALNKFQGLALAKTVRK